MESKLVHFEHTLFDILIRHSKITDKIYAQHNPYLAREGKFVPSLCILFSKSYSLSKFVSKIMVYFLEFVIFFSD